MIPKSSQVFHHHSLVAGVIIFQLLDYAAFKDALQQASEEPAEVVIATCAFLIAFILRAIAWKKSYRQ
ncbi:MAG: hypothetical protein CM15mP49_23740 [Actinomycetota bacterium]|nr:MAG: hypothetical protein CM15mP49_23740 [Actinomycetota bacterium]